MTPARVIADSDDEEDDFSPIKPAEETVARDPRLDMEPLSPHHQPTSPIVRHPSLLAVSNTKDDTSGSTDPSFFAGIYDDHQTKALQQSHLIESIVRLSQKASASSGDISLPAKGRSRSKKEVSNASSAATDVTSPRHLKRQAPRKSQLAQMSDATEFTTPRESAAKDEWDVPSSGDEGGDTEEKRTTLPSRVSTSNGDDSGNFYVATSNLSSLQKRQYKKVQISEAQSGESAILDSAGQMQPPSNYKSSCATTVAVSTPSRYASSGPRPPWETEHIPDAGDRSAAIDLSLSSPDAIAVNDADHGEDESPVRRSSMKRKRPKVLDEDDDDELAQDDIFEDPLSDLDPEFGTSSRKAPKKIKQSARVSSEVPAVEPKKRGRKKKQPVSEVVVDNEEAQDVQVLPTTAPSPPEEPQTPAGKPKKKRGRPRKSEAAGLMEAKPDVLPTSEEPAKMAAVELDPTMDTPIEEASTTIEDSWKQAPADPSAESENIHLEPTSIQNPKGTGTPLRDTDGNTMVKSQSTTISDSDKSITKSVTPSQVGKVGYRIGLSKRSRIAPLLKIIRK